MEVSIKTSVAVIKKTGKFPWPVLVFNSSPFLIYGAIVDYTKGKHYSVSVSYDLFDSKDLQQDITKLADTISTIARQQKITKVKYSGRGGSVEFLYFLKALRAKGLQVI